MRWAGAYLGRDATNTPSAWVLLRESGYRDSWYRAARQL
jgi:hypothetical protein